MCVGASGRLGGSGDAGAFSGGSAAGLDGLEVETAVVVEAAAVVDDSVAGAVVPVTDLGAGFLTMVPLEIGDEDAGFFAATALLTSGARLGGGEA